MTIDLDAIEKYASVPQTGNGEIILNLIAHVRELEADEPCWKTIKKNNERFAEILKTLEEGQKHAQEYIDHRMQEDANRIKILERALELASSQLDSECEAMNFSSSHWIKFAERDIADKPDESQWVQNDRMEQGK